MAIISISRILIISDQTHFPGSKELPQGRKECVIQALKAVYPILEPYPEQEFKTGLIPGGTLGGKLLTEHRDHLAGRLVVYEGKSFVLDEEAELIQSAGGLALYVSILRLEPFIREAKIGLHNVGAYPRWISKDEDSAWVLHLEPAESYGTFPEIQPDFRR